MPKTDTSIQYFETKLSQDPESLVFSRLADRYRKNGDIQQAISMCTEGLRNHPDYVTGRVVLGRCFLEQEKLQEAIAEFVKVLELDRRNQVAVKMIADIYSTQGMKEKAGDLYSFLLRMDPDNKSLVKLTSTFRGQGETSIQKIIGIAGESSEPGAEEEFAVATPSDVIVDADRTIQMDRVSTQPEMRTLDNVDFGETLITTQKFDATELGAAAERAEEITVETSDKQGGVVTGDDISSRMDTLFGEPETPAVAAESAGDLGAETADKREGSVTGDDISSRMDTLFGGGETIAAAAEPETLDHVDIGMEHSMEHTETSAQTRTDGKDDWVVSGSDISSRLEQLFGEEQKAEKAEAVGPEADFTQIIDTQETGETQLPAPKTSLSTAPTKELVRDELRPVESTDLSTEDITSRLNEMFDEVPVAEPLGKDTDVGGKPVVEIEETPVFDVATDIPAKSMTGATEETAVAGEGKTPAAEPQGQDTDVTSLPAVEIEETPVFDVAADTPTASVTGATEEIALPGARKAPAAPAGEAGISGDDVAFRLETIFEEGEAEAAGPDVAGTDVIPAEELDTLQQAEDAKQPLDTGEHPIVVGDEDEGIEETIIAPAAKRPAEKAGDQDKKSAAAAPAIDDMEEEDASPTMSGDDVAGRLEEIFNEIPVKGGDLKPAEAVHDGDRVDEAVTQAFHPRSGENAQTAESDETMLSDLDQSEETMLSEPGKVEAAAPEAETLDMAREPEEKTVLMDEDDSDETMITEEETILSGVRDPFLPTPPRARAKIDEREKDETVRAAAPPPRHDAASIKKPPEEPREEPDADQTEAYSIPDHVLTPTLADIYYQQGQPQLALQIYRRLLSADPDNERMAQRIAEIERGLATQEADETVAMEHARKKTGAPKPPVTSEPKEKKTKKSAGPRPLAGVRIKRKFKAKRKNLK